MSALVLIVEDDPNDAFFLTDALTQAGVKNPLQVVRDGAEAVDYLKGQGKFRNREVFPFPALVLLDLKLPRVSGFEVLKWVRQTFGPGLPILPLSSSENELDIAEAYRLGANGYLLKPNGVAEYTAMARALKDFWLALNRLPSRFDPNPEDASSKDVPKRPH